MNAVDPDVYVKQEFLFFRARDGGSCSVFIPRFVWEDDEEFHRNFGGRYVRWIEHEILSLGSDAGDFDLDAIAKGLDDEIERLRPEWREIQDLVGLKEEHGIGQPARLLRLNSPAERDWLVPGLIARGGVTLVQGREKLDIALDTPVPTPDGWTTQGELRPGDTVFSENGQQIKVLSTTPVFTGRPCYRVVFSDGTEVVASGEHGWTTMFLDKGKYREIETTTDGIRATLKLKSGQNRHSVRVNGSIQTEPKDLPIDPYILGLWLGDGDTRSSCITVGLEDVEHAEHEILSAGYFIHSRKFQLNPQSGESWRLYVSSNEIRGSKDSLRSRLRRIKVFGDKHIPTEYLRASHDQRLDLLRGLMDSDGCANSRGQCCFACQCQKLFDGFVELCTSLGIKIQVNSDQLESKFVTDLEVFRLQRKRKLQKDPRPMKVSPRSKTKSKWIVSVDPVDSVPTKCIEVDTPSHLYLVGDGMVPTHNSGKSTLIFNIVGAMERNERTMFGAAYGRPVRSLIVTEEPEYALRDKCEKFNLRDAWIVEDWVWPLDRMPGGSVQKQWEYKLEQVERLAHAIGAEHVVIDPFSRVGAVEDESGREPGMRAEAVSSMAYRGKLAVTIIHHNNKGADRAVEDRGRGSTSLQAAVEQIVQIDRAKEERDDKKKSRRREAVSWGRVEEADWIVTFELADD